MSLMTELVLVKFWDRVLFEFLENLNTETTRSGYRTDLKLFTNFLKVAFPEVQDFSKVESLHCIAYRKYLNSKKYASKSIHRKLTSISTFYEFLVIKEAIKTNPMGIVKRGTAAAVNPTEALDDDEAMSVIKIIETWEVGPYKAIMFILLATGIRRAEVLNICLKDFVVYDGKVYLRVVGKGGKEVEKLIPDWIYQHVVDHLNSLSAQGVTINPGDKIFVYKTKKNIWPVTTVSLHRRIKLLIIQAGISKRISTHSFRATYITSAIDTGIDTYKLQQDVGHSDIKTTMSYNRKKKKRGDSPANFVPFLKRA